MPRHPALVAALALVLLASTPGQTTAAADRGRLPWRWPVPPPVSIARPYEAPVTRYAAGHRGVDLDAPAGTPVLAAADGTVSFAGQVVDRGVVSIAHAGGYVTSVEPIAPAVAAGDEVRRGEVVGTVAAGGHAAAGTLHVGVRRYGEYLSPVAMLGGIPRSVLLPLD